MRHRIFDEIREDILSCGLPPGAELREGELARRYGVSKSPIRDALQKLEYEGLVEIAPRQGHRIVPLSVGDASDIIEMRELLEVAAVRKVARAASEADLAALDAYREADTGSLRAFARYNRAFHAEICRLTGNGRQAAAMGSLMDNYERLCILSLSARHREAEAIGTALADHIAIIDALQARDGRAAARISVRHLRRSHGEIMRALANRPVVA